MARLAVALILGLAAGAPARAGASVGTAELRADIAVLADDAMEGRGTGTPGGARAEAWVQAAFAGMGLQPGAARGGWRQIVPVRALVGRVPRPGRPLPGPLHPANIVGRVSGRDPRAGAVMLMAHLDHLGFCRAAGDADRICNGANDNASGTAVLLAVARRIASGPRPARSVYFVATTGEEMGRLGSHWLAEHPPLPLRRIVAVLNLDMVAGAGRDAPLAVLGRGRFPALDAAIDASARRLGRRMDPGTHANILEQRQDGWSFASRDVPAAMVNGSLGDMTATKAFFASRYHKPDDDLAHLPPLDGVAQDADLHVALVHTLADPATYPAAPNRN